MKAIGIPTIFSVFFFSLFVSGVYALDGDEISYTLNSTERKTVSRYGGKRAVRSANRAIQKLIRADRSDKNVTLLNNPLTSEKLYLKRSPQFGERSFSEFNTSTPHPIGVVGELMKVKRSKRELSRSKERRAIRDIIRKDLTGFTVRSRRKLRRIESWLVRRAESAVKGHDARAKNKFLTCTKVALDLPSAPNPFRSNGGDVSFASKFSGGSDSDTWKAIGDATSLDIDGSGVVTFKAIFSNGSESYEVLSSDPNDAVIVIQEMNLYDELLLNGVGVAVAREIENRFSSEGLVDSNGRYLGDTVIFFKGPDGEFVELTLTQPNSTNRGRPIGFDCVPYLVWNHRVDASGIDATGENYHFPGYPLTDGTYSMVSIADGDGEDAYVTAVPVTFSEETTVLQIKSLSNKIDNDFTDNQLGDIFLEVFSSITAFEMGISEGDLIANLDLEPIEIVDFGGESSDEYHNKLLTYQSEPLTLPAGEYLFVVWSDNNHSFNHAQSLISQTGGISGNDRIGSNNWDQSYPYNLTPGFEGTAAIDIYVTNDYR